MTLATGVAAVTPSRKNSPYYENGTIPWLVIGDLNDGEVKEFSSSITEEGLANSSAKLIPSDSVLVAMYGSIGKLGITTFPCTTNQAIAFCIPNDELISLRYLFHALANAKPELIAKGQGGAQQNISQGILKEHLIPLAPLNEQRRIAAKLDTTLAAVEACRQRLDGVAAILKRFRQAVLAAATSGELTREWREENSVDEPWQCVSLSSFAESRLGKMLDQSKNAGQPTPYLRNINVRWFTFDLSDIQSIKISDNERCDLDIRYGDLLVCEGGEPGRCAVWRGPDSEYTFQKALHRIRPSPLLAADCLAYCIRNSADNGSLSELFTGTTIKHLTGRSLARYPVPLPSRKEQNEIIDQVENLS